MRHLFFTLFLLSSLITFAQQPSFKTWQSEAKKDKNMLPEYGNQKKTDDEVAADQQFIANLQEAGKSNVEAAHQMIRLGFDYLYKGDLKTAMYRFNQAYLLNPKNEGIYWGYGAIYTAFGEYETARKQYEKGLKLNSESAPIITDYGTTYLGEYYDNVRSNHKKALSKLSLAKDKLLASYAIDPEYISTAYKLSIVFLNSQDCENAKKYLKATRELGGQPITKEYLSDFNLRCGNCTSVKTGTFQIETARNGYTKIERTKKYQIEKNESLGYKIKLKIDWLDECTYTLTPIADLNSNIYKVPTGVLTCQIIEVNHDSYIQVTSTDKNQRRSTSKIEFVQ